MVGKASGLISVIIHLFLFFGLSFFMEEHLARDPLTIFGETDKLSVVEFVPIIDDQILVSKGGYQKKKPKKKKKKKAFKKEPQKKLYGSKYGVKVSQRKRYFYELRMFLQQEAVNRYPLSAARMRLEGTVILSMRIDKKGFFSILDIQKSSNYEVFNRASRELMNSLDQFKPFPGEMIEDFVDVEVPVRYEQE